MKYIITAAALMAATSSQASTLICSVENEPNVSIAITDDAIDVVMHGQRMPTIEDFKVVPGKGKFKRAITLFLDNTQTAKIVFPKGPSSGGLTLDSKTWYDINCKLTGEVL